MHSSFASGNVYCFLPINRTRMILTLYPSEGCIISLNSTTIRYPYDSMGSTHHCRPLLQFGWQ